MAKFYVASGTLQLVTEAEDARGAALWAVQRCLEQVLPICPDDPQTPEQKAERALQRGCDVLGPTIVVNERGFGRSDSAAFDTAELFVEWNQLMMAVTALERKLRVVCLAE
jgi:hypothetical protein